MTKNFAVIIAAFAALMLASCGQGDVLRVKEAVVQISNVEGNPAAGYLKLGGGTEDVTLLQVVSDDALRVEMFETRDRDGMSRMDPITEVEVPAHEIIPFEPGAKHLMIWGVSRAAQERGTIPLIFIFSNDDRILVDARVTKFGEEAAGEE